MSWENAGPRGRPWRADSAAPQTHERCTWHECCGMCPNQGCATRLCRLGAEEQFPWLCEGGTIGASHALPAARTVSYTHLTLPTICSV
eukprot:269801-Alexandrium_andersonii.AAC.1